MRQGCRRAEERLTDHSIQSEKVTGPVRRLGVVANLMPTLIARTQGRGIDFI